MVEILGEELHCRLTTEHLRLRHVDIIHENQSLFSNRRPEITFLSFLQLTHYVILQLLLVMVTLLDKDYVISLVSQPCEIFKNPEGIPQRSSKDSA